MPELTDPYKVAALAGGVGGARLSQGLTELLPPERLSIIVNTGDDFEHLGLKICPDLDTVVYTLAWLANSKTGWGIADDTRKMLDLFIQLGGPGWFSLGDRDLATHLRRTQLLREGYSLTETTRRIASALGVRHPILPMCDMPMPTRVVTEIGEMEFQEYFVKWMCQPKALRFVWPCLPQAQPSAEVIRALSTADLIVFCPSNPFVSIDPILMLPGVRDLIKERMAVAVSPILAGSAVKGPAAKMFAELGITPSAVAVAEHYRDLISGFVMDEVDAQLLPDVLSLDMQATAIPTLMPDRPERKTVAQGVLDFALQISRSKKS